MFESIKTNGYGDTEPGVEILSYLQEDKIESVLMGHKIVKVNDEHLVLDDGTVLKAVGNIGGCACSAGDYDLTELNGVDNIITRVEFVDVEDDYDTFYRLYVYAENKKIKLMEFRGDDGSGYYGSGYDIYVRKVK